MTDKEPFFCSSSSCIFPFIASSDASEFTRSRFFVECIHPLIVHPLRTIPRLNADDDGSDATDPHQLKIEDILPFFPDFVKIADFKDEICDSLDHYNDHIEKLKEEMDEYTQNANLIRKDITQLRNRFGFVGASQKCDLCAQVVTCLLCPVSISKHVYQISNRVHQLFFLFKTRI
jgi:hypothetical protein